VSLGCASGCGACCDPVVLDFGTWTKALEQSRRCSAAEADSPREWASVVFIARHWHPVAAWRTDSGEPKIDLRCDAFDPGTRLCTAREDRPPVCRDYPWYGDDPVTCGRGPDLYPSCSYLADLPPSQRPEGARPLIPITPVAAPGQRTTV
jgi:Fe-S-cluster containining protein